MSGVVGWTVEGGLATARLSRQHGNAINGELIEALVAACRQAAADRSVRGLLLAASGKLFCPGLDLQELIELDRVGMGRFLGRFRACLLELYTFGKPMVAAIHGHAIAGGCILTMTADWRVLRRGAMVGLNEVRVGVPFPFEVAMILRQSVAPAHLEEVALLGRNYSDEQALAAGLVHELQPADGFEESCRQRLDELAGKDPRAFSITKRYLRSPTVDRIQSAGSRFAHEFLDAWFSPETQQRVRGIVQELQARST